MVKRSNIRLDEYTKRLWEERNKEVIKETAENIVSLKSGQGLTSPASELPLEELKLVQQHMHQTNLLNMAKALPEKKKDLILKKFFKHKRNQQVEVFVVNDRKPLHLLGKVNTVGRDFVSLITLKDRHWIPFSRIESAKIPYGLPEVSSAHQHFAYDEELRRNLITRFSETVASKDILIQQFFEETLQTNLQTWKDTRVQISTTNVDYTGKIVRSNDGIIELSRKKCIHTIPMKEITLIKTIRLFSFFTDLLRKNRSNA